MADLAIITPTRGRPVQFAGLLQAVANTTRDAQVWIGLDYDDMTDYQSVLQDSPGADRIVPARGVRRSLSEWTNLLADRALSTDDPPRYLASLGDDHRPWTVGWDEELIGEIRRMGGTGFAYGNDLLQGPDLPTAWVVSADIVRALGWMMLPDLAHQYVDNVTLELGRAVDRIAYRPDVVIEHLHPSAGKSEVDDSYRATNSAARTEADRRAFEAWRSDGLARDAATVATLLDYSAAR